MLMKNFLTDCTQLFSLLAFMQFFPEINPKIVSFSIRLLSYRYTGRFDQVET